MRAALRQDPDIIMVGEIRDKETAQLAIQAALTGHLVLSTIHTNNSIGVIPRLIDMGVDPYLIAPTLKLAIAQRLARRLCDKSGKEEEITTSTKMMMDQSFKTLPQRYIIIGYLKVELCCVRNRLLAARLVCEDVAVMEALEVNEEIQELILHNSSEEQMFLTARKNGFMTMKEDAIIKALDHVIPYEEMNTFGTKVGLESLPEEVATPVDNPVAKTDIPAIINLNEDITG